MRESKLYLNFLKENLTLFIISGMLFSFLGFLIQQQNPPKFEVYRLLEITNTGRSVIENEKLVQEAVTLTRSENIRKGNQTSSEILAFNNSPLTLQIISTSSNKQIAVDDLNKTTDFLEVKFPFTRAGEDVLSTKFPNLFLGTLIGFLTGEVLALLYILSRRYLKSF